MSDIQLFMAAVGVYCIVDRLCEFFGEKHLLSTFREWRRMRVYWRYYGLHRAAAKSVDDSHLAAVCTVQYWFNDPHWTPDTDSKR